MIAWLLRPISVWIRRLYSESDPISRSNCCGQSFSMYCRHSYIFYLQKKGRVQNYFTIWTFSSISLLGIVIDNLAFRLFVQTNPFERLIWRIKIHVKLLKTSTKFHRIIFLPITTSVFQIMPINLTSKISGHFWKESISPHDNTTPISIYEFRNWNRWCWLFGWGPIY